MASTRPSRRAARSLGPVARPGIQPDAVFTIDDLVAYLKLPKSTVYKLAQEGKIPGQKVGRHWRFRKDIIDDWLAAGVTPKLAAGR